MKRINFLFILPLLFVLASCNRDPKVASENYVKKGNGYYDKGKYKEASIMYRRALQKDKLNGDAYYRLGLVNMKQAMYGEARHDFMRAADLPNANADALGKLADIDLAFYLTDPQGAKQLLGEVKDLTHRLLVKDPKSYDGLRLSGYLALSQKDYPGAIKLFEEADRSKPDQPDLIMALVQALFYDKRPDEAEKYLTGLIERKKNFGGAYDYLYNYYARTGRPDQAEAIIKKKVANNPTQGEYLVQLAAHYFNSNRKPEMQATLNRLTSDPKTFPNSRMLVGDFYYRVRNFDQAVQEYREGIKIDAKEKLVYQKKIVEALAIQGKSDQAAKVVSDLLKDNPQDAEVVGMHAALMLPTANKAQVQQIIDELQKVVSKAPNNAILHFNLGRAYMAKGDNPSLEQARLQFQQTVKINPNYVPAKVALTQLELNKGENAKAVQTSDEILSIDPKNLSAKLMRSMGMAGMGEFDKARQELHAAITEYPRSNDARYQLAMVDFMQKKYSEAEQGFEELRKANDPRGLIGVLEVKSRRGEFKEVIQAIEDQLRRTPDRADLRVALANTYYSAKQFNEAAAEYQKLIDKDPKAGEMYLRLGECKRAAGDTSGAMTAFEKAKTLMPTDPVARLQLGMLLDVAGRKDEARKAYEEVLKLQPDNPVALNNLAYSKADDGVDLDQALTFAERARLKQPSDPNILDTLGLIYLKKNLTDDGLRLLHELTQRVPDNPTYRLHYAQALYQKGNKPDAKKELQAALRYNPSDREQVKIKELMAKIG
jgi:tetratricopeptide (TPR) repeat protein